MPQSSLFVSSLAVIAGLLATGCATSPIPQNIRQQANPNLTLQTVQQKPDSYLGQKVLWGGFLIDVRNLQTGTTAQILEAPLDSQARPHHIESSAGRFLASFNRYLDKALFRPGRRITIEGTVSGSTSQVLNKNETPQTLPIVAVNYYYLWPLGTRSQDYPPPYYDPYWGMDWGPGWGTNLGFGFWGP